MKLTLDIDKAIVLRVRGNPETVNLELSEETSRKIYGPHYQLNGTGSLRIVVTKGTGEKVCEDLGIPSSLVSVIDDSVLSRKLGTREPEDDGEFDASAT